MDRRQGNRTGLIVAVLVILSLTIGLGSGLLIGWVIAPVKYVDTAFADLAPESKEEYILLVASAYGCDQDLDKAQARLAMLDAPNINQWVADLVDRYISAGQDEADIRALVALANGLGVNSPRMAAYVASPTPLPTHTPPPTPTPSPTQPPAATPISLTAEPSQIPPTEPPPTPLPPTKPPQPKPTATPVPPASTSVPPTNTPAPPTDTPLPPTDTPVPPTNTAVPPTNTAKPKPTNTPKPPTNTPKPPAAKWSNSAQLVGPGQDAQGCTYGLLQIRVTVVGANGNQLPGIWVYDKYSNTYMVTGNVDSPDWGPGETKFEYGIGGGGSLCIASGEGGGCVSDYTRDMPCYYLPPFDDLWAAGYCQCEKPDITLEECRQLSEEGKLMSPGAGHFSWRVVFRRSS
jgi:hypothetical protein